MGINPENYIARNKYYVARNCISFFLWEGKPFSKTLAEEKEYLQEWLKDVDSKQFVASTIDLLKTMVDKDGVASCLEVIKKDDCKYCYRSMQEYIAKEFEREWLTLQRIASIVQQQILLIENGGDAA